MLIKQKIPSLPRNLDFWHIANSVFSKGKYAIPPLFNILEVLSSASDKAKLFAKNISKNCNLEGSGLPLPAFPLRTNLKLHNIYVTPKIVKKVIMILDLPKACAGLYLGQVTSRKWWVPKIGSAQKRALSFQIHGKSAKNFVCSKQLKLQ